MVGWRLSPAGALYVRGVVVSAGPVCRLTRTGCHGARDRCGLWAVRALQPLWVAHWQAQSGRIGMGAVRPHKATRACGSASSPRLGGGETKQVAWVGGGLHNGVCSGGCCGGVRMKGACRRPGHPAARPRTTPNEGLGAWWHGGLVENGAGWTPWGGVPCGLTMGGREGGGVVGFSSFSKLGNSSLGSFGQPQTQSDPVGGS